MPEIGSNIARADIDLIDGSFDISQSENYNLFIQIGMDGLSFCLFNTIFNKFVVLRSYSLSGAEISDYRAIFECDDLLGLRYGDSRHIWISPRCTLVPENLFDNREADLYLTFNHGKAAGGQTLHNYIRSANLYNVFSYPEALTTLFQLYQPNIRFFHHATPLIEHMSTMCESNVSVYYYSGNLDITIMEKTKLLFYNTFQINVPEDSVYYYTMVLNSLSISHLSTRLLYAGNCTNMPSEIAILKDFSECVIDFEPPSDVAYSDCIPESFRKDFINLFNLYRCE